MSWEPVDHELATLAAEIGLAAAGLYVVLWVGRDRKTDEWTGRYKELAADTKTDRHALARYIAELDRVGLVDVVRPARPTRLKLYRAAFVIAEREEREAEKERKKPHRAKVAPKTAMPGTAPAPPVGVAQFRIDKRAREVFEAWQEVGVVPMRSLDKPTHDMVMKAIEWVSEGDVTCDAVAEIKSAIHNYGLVVRGPQFWYDRTTDLLRFCSAYPGHGGLYAFLDVHEPLKRFLGAKRGGKPAGKPRDPRRGDPKDACAECEMAPESCWVEHEGESVRACEVKAVRA